MPATTGARTTLVYLQLGAFGSRENAEAARSRLSRQLDGLTQPIDVLQEGALFKVRTGPFVQREEALAAAERIRLATDYRAFPMTR